MKRLFASLVVIFVMVVSGCTISSSTPQPLIIATLFPQYDFAKTLVGSNAEVRLLVPAGVDAHDFEPSAQDILDILNADLFIYTGDIMEPWVASAILPLVTDSEKIIDMSQGIELLATHEEDSGDTHGDEGLDPHFWVDPENAKKMVTTLVNALVRIFPNEQNQIKTSGDALLNGLDELHLNWLDLVAKAEQKTIIFAGHFALGYVAQKYQFEAVSPYEGYTADQEPLYENIIAMIERMQLLNIEVVYYEEAMDQEIALSLSQPTGASLLPLNPGATIIFNAQQESLSYLQLMQRNIDNLKIGMKYHE